MFIDYLFTIHVDVVGPDCRFSIKGTPSSVGARSTVINNSNKIDQIFLLIKPKSD